MEGIQACRYLKSTLIPSNKQKKKDVDHNLCSFRLRYQLSSGITSLSSDQSKFHATQDQWPNYQKYKIRRAGTNVLRRTHENCEWTLANEKLHEVSPRYINKKILMNLRHLMPDALQLFFFIPFYRSQCWQSPQISSPILTDFVDIW